MKTLTISILILLAMIFELTVGCLTFTLYFAYNLDNEIVPITKSLINKL